jgi:hypothetical protein
VGKYWTSGTDRNCSGKLFWCSENLFFKQKDLNWAKDQPKNSDGDCVSLTGTLNVNLSTYAKEKCTNQLQYICELKSTMSIIIKMYNTIILCVNWCILLNQFGAMILTRLQFIHAEIIVHNWSSIYINEPRCGVYSKSIWCTLNAKYFDFGNKSYDIWRVVYYLTMRQFKVYRKNENVFELKQWEHKISQVQRLMRIWTTISILNKTGDRFTKAIHYILVSRSRLRFLPLWPPPWAEWTFPNNLEFFPLKSQG